SGIAHDAATLAGTLFALDQYAEVEAYFGTSDGGNSPASWEHALSLGGFTNAAEDLAVELSGLTPDTTYYFSFRVTNHAAIVWPPASFSFTTPAQPVTDLHLSKSVQPTNLISGSNLTYRLTLSNSGPDAASAIITDTLPPQLRFISAMPPPTEVIGRAYSFNLADLPPESNAVVIIAATVTSVVDTITNAASVTTTANDTNLLNNTASAETTLPDFDNDGLKDFVDPDDDNDTVSDEDEAIADTDPRDPDAFLWVRVDRTAMSSVQTLTFPSSSNRSYFIQTRTNLMIPPWETHQTNIPGTGDMLVFPRTNDLDLRYYRIGVTVP
ncbi:MAG: DUF11 domain-containing protein, partial [Verrucomicrobiota bacterium]